METCSIGYNSNVDKIYIWVQISSKLTIGQNRTCLCWHLELQAGVPVGYATERSEPTDAAN